MSDSLVSLFNKDLKQVQLIINGNNYELLADVLAKHSDFFKTELENIPPSYSVSTNEESSFHLVHKKVIKIDDVELNADVVEQVLKFMYGVSFEITKDNFNDVMKVCAKFQTTMLDEQTYDYIYKSTEPQNFFDSCFVKSIYKSISFEKYLKERIMELKKDELFKFILSLSLDKICEILSADDLKCSEDFIFDLALHYHTSISDSAKVMSCVRLTRLSKYYLINKPVAKYVNDDAYRKALEFHLFGKSSNKEKERIYKSIHFRIGKYDGEYEGYRMTTADDCNKSTFKYLFKESYLGDDGLLSLDDFVGNVLCNKENPFRIGNSYVNSVWIGLNRENIRKNDVVKIKKNGNSNIGFDDFDTLINYSGHMSFVHRPEQRIGLFVPNDIKFD